MYADGREIKEWDFDDGEVKEKDVEDGTRIPKSPSKIEDEDEEPTQKSRRKQISLKRPAAKKNIERYWKTPKKEMTA